MSRIATVFDRLRREGRTGLVTYITAGDPSLARTRDVLLGLGRAGADVIEVGVPFSDPIADGPDIQRASEWALRSHVGVAEVFALVRDFRRDSQVPVVLMTYANPVVKTGATKFASAAAEAGTDGVIVSDLPPEELPDLWSAFDSAGVDTVMLVAPTTRPERAAVIARRTRGFLYALARTGVTGNSAGESTPLPERLAQLRPLTDLPIGIGFGISNGEQARALKGVADAVIVGAAFMRQVAQDPENGAAARVGSLARELVAAIS